MTEAPQPAGGQQGQGQQQGDTGQQRNEGAKPTPEELNARLEKLNEAIDRHFKGLGA